MLSHTPVISSKQVDLCNLARMKNNWLNYYKYYVFFSRSGVWVINKYRSFDDMFNSYCLNQKAKQKQKKYTLKYKKKTYRYLYIKLQVFTWWIIEFKRFLQVIWWMMEKW